MHQISASAPLDKHNYNLDPRLNKQEVFVEANLNFSTFPAVIGYS